MEEKIEIKVTIRNVEEWDVDWSDYKKTQGELTQVTCDVRRAISQLFGIEISKIDVSTIKDTKQ